MSMQKINRPRIIRTRSETSRLDSDILGFRGKPLPIKRLKDATHDMTQEVGYFLWQDLLVMRVALKRRCNIDKIELSRGKSSICCLRAAWPYVFRLHFWVRRIALEELFEMNYLN